MKGSVIGKITLFGVSFSLCASFSIHETPILAKEANVSEFTIHMLSLGGEGDCSLIKYGNTDILIDAGGVKSSADLIRKNLDEYVTDNVLEYVIFSHADGDHVVNAKTAVGGWMDQGGSIGLLVDFDISQDSTCKHSLKRDFFDNSPEYESYANDFRDAYKKKGKIQRYVPVGMLNWKKRNIDEATIKKAIAGSGLDFSNLGDEYRLLLNPSSSDPYVLASQSSGATIKFLYNHYYDNAMFGKVAGDSVDSADKNVISVCTMLKLKKNGGGYKRILYNGDLEEYSGYNLKTISDGNGSTGGETMLLKLNEEEFKDPITFYKASHHGSNTSNDPYFLERIRPNYIGINAVAGGRYDFPTQKPEEKADSSTMIEMTKFTDRIYITDMAEKSEDGKNTENVPYYGNIVFTMGKDKEDVLFQNPSTLMPWGEGERRSNEIFADTLWYRQNRLYEADVINLTCPGKAIINLSYVKLGHVDILIGAGANPHFLPTKDDIAYLKDKISSLCNDGILEYLVVPGLSSYSYQILEDILSSKGIAKIERAIYFHSPIEDNTIGKKVKEVKKILSSSGKIDTIQSFRDGLSYNLFSDSEDYSLSFYGDINSTESSPSFYTLFKAEDYYYLHCGDDPKYAGTGTLENVVKGKVNTFQMAKCGEFDDLGLNKEGSIGSFDRFYDLYVNSKAKHNVLLNNALHFVDGHLNINVYFQNQARLTKGGLYPTKAMKNGKLIHKEGQENNTINGDVVSRAMLSKGKPDVRTATSRSLIGFSLCVKGCSKRSEIHKNSYAVPLDAETIKLLKGD